MAARKITLRVVQESDNEFLLKVYGSTREQELAQVPWTAEQKQHFVHMQWEAQKNHYAAQHPQATHEIICLEGTDAGRLYLDRAGEKFHILDITLLPEYRNRGAGSFLLGQIMAEAKEAGKPVSIYVETFNPSLRLFQRLGFTPIQQEGFHLLLQCAG
ncbi:MAG TPA: GNAT family N-acetyltransferase [Candidatus Angelobacter sp.]|nr:GNAT family N-acetyltransferase [Candidatus Angelobacter sp.]